VIFIKKPARDDPAWKRMIEEAAQDVEWEDIIQKALVAREELIKDFDEDNEIKINATLYKRYMSFLLKLFNGKCAYCEAKISLTQPGDVEHFRPKGRVVDENFKPIRVKHPKKGEIVHPGYYWLAYDWKNLLPSCIDCNRYRNLGTVPEKVLFKADAGAGKADRFPIKDEAYRAVVPDAEAEEGELLINPSEVNPLDHLEFFENGTIQAKTVEGEATLKVFGLNAREDLIEARADAFDDAGAIFERYTDAIKAGDPPRQSRSAKRLNRMMAGGDAYSAMHFLAISKALGYWKKNGIEIPTPFREGPQVG
jgi:hypothetical protein